jgi:hypothetical protein
MPTAAQCFPFGEKGSKFIGAVLSHSCIKGDSANSSIILSVLEHKTVTQMRVVFGTEQVNVREKFFLLSNECSSANTFMEHVSLKMLQKVS